MIINNTLLLLKNSVSLILLNKNISNHIIKSYPTKITIIFNLILYINNQLLIITNDSLLSFIKHNLFY